MTAATQPPVPPPFITRHRLYRHRDVTVIAVATAVQMASDMAKTRRPPSPAAPVKQPDKALPGNGGESPGGEVSFSSRMRGAASFRPFDTNSGEVIVYILYFHAASVPTTSTCDLRHHFGHLYATLIVLLSLCMATALETAC